MKDKNPLTLVTDGEYPIRVIQGKVAIQDVEGLRSRAKELVDYLDSIVIDEDTAKAGQRLAAGVRKSIRELRESRRAAKELYLEPFEAVDREIAEAERSVKESEDRLREQLRRLEDKRQFEKYQEIERVFNLRKEHYEKCGKAISIQDFFRPEFLNKTYPMSKVESEMVKYMESIRDDVEFLEETVPEKDIEEAKKDYARVHDIKHVVRGLRIRNMTGLEVETSRLTEVLRFMRDNGIDYEML